MAKVRSFKNPTIEYANGIDTRKRVSKFLEIQGIPHMILIDPNGIVRWEGFPALQGYEFTEEILENILDKYGA